jgi:putative spermidine/putrescine transport system ATP-binding protein
LSLRPERVSIGVDVGQTENSLEAKVEELIYLGDHLRSRISLSGNDQFIVKVPNSHGHVHLKEGEITQIGWEAEDCRALDG